MANDTSDGRVSISYVIDRLDGLVSQDTAALSDISSFVEFRDELVFNLGQNVLERSRTGDRPDFAAVGLDSNFGPYDIYGRIKWVVRDCMTAALRETNGNKASATRLLDMNSLQTFLNWVKRYDVKCDVD